MSQTNDVLDCANCGLLVLNADAEALGWRFWSDGAGELHLICPLCAHREFADDAPASVDL